MKEKNNYRELLWLIAVTDFKLRYHGSMLGYLWTLLKPLALFGVMFVVFSLFMKMNIPHYQLYLLLGIMLWNFFAEATMAGVHALASKVGIIKKIYFPRIIVVIASTISAFIGLFFNLIIFAIFFAFSGLALSWNMLFFPLLILGLYFFVLGLSLLLSVLYVLFRDLNQVWDVLLQIGFWLTPIIYSLQFVPTQFHFWLFLNPMTGYIQYARLLMIEQQIPTFSGVAYLALFSLGSLLLGYTLFQRYEFLAPEKL